MRRSLVLLGAALAPILPAQDAAVDPLVELQAEVQRAAARVAPCVVRVETFGGVRRTAEGGLAVADGAQPERRRPQQRPRPKDDEEHKAPDDKEDPRKRGLAGLVAPGFLQAQGATTGLILAADGWIAISRFALAYDPSTILVTLADGRSFQAERKGEDTSRGIALVKIEATGLPVPEILDPHSVRVGQWAIVLGRTFGQQHPSVHLGIVSATRRIFGRAVQVDANCSPANYGGPMIDLDGRVIGVCAPLSPAGRDAGADWYDSGIGFAATLGDIGTLLARMREGAVLHRGWLGITTDPKFAGPGAKVASVDPASTAAGIGIRPKDVVRKVDGQPVRHHFELQMKIAARLAGETVQLELGRGDETVTAAGVLSPLPAAQRAAEKKGRVDDPMPWEDKK